MKYHTISFATRVNVIELIYNSILFHGGGHFALYGILLVSFYESRNRKIVIEFGVDVDFD